MKTVDSIPACLKPRVLKAGEREALITQCRKDINTDGAKAAIEIVRQFGEFCELLSQPENQIKVLSGQYIEKEVNCRTIADMNNEMAGELMELQKYKAYAKLLREE